MTLSDSATLAEANRRPPRRTAGRGALPPPLRLGATSSNCMPGLKTSTAADEPPVADEAADRGIATLYESLLAQLKSTLLLPDTFVAMASTKSRLIKRMCIVKRSVQQCCALPPPYETLRVIRRRLTRSRTARATLCLTPPAAEVDTPLRTRSPHCRCVPRKEAVSGFRLGACALLGDRLDACVGRGRALQCLRHLSD